MRDLQKRFDSRPFNSVRLSTGERKFILSLGDFLFTSLAGIVALGLWRLTREEPFIADLHLFGPWIPLASLLWVLLLWVFDLYKAGMNFRTSVIVERYFGVSLVSLLCYLLFFFVAPRNVLPRLPVLYLVVLATIFGVAWRLGLGLVTSFAKTAFQHRLLVIGADWSGRALLEAIREVESRDYKIIGFIDDIGSQGGEFSGIPILGTVKDTLEVAFAHDVNVVVYSTGNPMRAELFTILLDCRTAGISVIPMATLYEELTERVPVQHIAEEWLLPTDLTGGQISLSYQVFVWFLDHVFALLGLVLLALITPIVAILIKLDSSGPVFYRQVRLGLGGKPFTMIKFRSMVRNAEEQNGPQWAEDDDARVTRVGRVLRRTRLDELPQVINILRGELHLIGPRPERPEFVAELETQIPFYRVRLALKPGLTGWAQIKFRYGGNVEETLIKLQYDLYYMKNRSPLLDLKILLHTVWKTLSFGGR